MRTSASSLALLVLLVCMAQTASGSTLYTDLVGFWAFNGTAADSSGHGRNMDLVGTTEWGSGPFAGRQAFVLSGDDYAIRPQNDTVFDLGADDFTLQIWVNFADFSHGEYAIFEKFTGPSEPGWTLDTAAAPQFWAPPLTLNSAEQGYSPNIWYRVAVRRTGSLVEIWRNNVVTDSMTSSETVPASDKPLLIGERDGSQQLFLRGSVAEAGIWKRALTNEEMQTLYTQGMPDEVPEPGSAWLLAGAGAALLACRHQKARRR